MAISHMTPIVDFRGEEEECLKHLGCWPSWQSFVPRPLKYSWVTDQGWSRWTVLCEINDYFR